MEHEDIPVHDLLGVGDEAAPGPDPLRAIVARAGRRRLRMAAGGMAVALAAGGAIGFSVSNHSSHPAQTATAAAPAAESAPSAAQNTAGASPSIGSGGGTALLAPYGATNLTRLFTRTAGPVTIRGYQINFTAPRGALPKCQVSGPTFQAEVSTASMVGVVSSGFAAKGTASAVNALDAQVIGTAEGDPTEVVTVATGTGVASVRMAFAGGGTDQMAPVKGWAALAAPVSGAAGKSAASQFGARVGVLTAFNSAGHQVASQTVTNGFNISPAGGAVGGAPGAAAAQPNIACLAAPPCTVAPGGSQPPMMKGAPVPATKTGSTAISPGAPTVSTSAGAASGSTASGSTSSGDTSSSGALRYACGVYPPPAPGSAGASAGSGGSGTAGASTGSSTGSGSASSGSASSGAATSSNG